MGCDVSLVPGDWDSGTGWPRTSFYFRITWGWLWDGEPFYRSCAWSLRIQRTPAGFVSFVDSWRGLWLLHPLRHLFTLASLTGGRGCRQSPRVKRDEAVFCFLIPGPLSYKKDQKYPHTGSAQECNSRPFYNRLLGSDSCELSRHFVLLGFFIDNASNRFL